MGGRKPTAEGSDRLQTGTKIPKMVATTTRVEYLYLTALKELIPTIINVLRSAGLDEREFLKISEPIETKEYIVICIGFVTKIEYNVRWWSEVVFCCSKRPILSKFDYYNICVDIHKMSFFKYNYYDRLYSRTCFVIADKYSSVVTADLVKRTVPIDIRVRKTFERTVFVPVNAIVGIEKALAVIFTYLGNFFTQRANIFIESIYGNTPRKVKYWSRVRMLFHGKLKSVYRSLSGLYNNIYYRVEFLEEKRSLSEEIAKILKLLVNLASSFTKLVDKYGQIVFNEVVAKETIEFLREKIGFYSIPKFAKVIVAVWNKIEEQWQRYLALKILRRPASTE